MKSAIFRTIQIGVALLVITVVMVATLVITGVLGRPEGVEIALEVTAVIAVCTAAGIALAAVFGVGSKAEP